jgi:hypothetical protein
MVDMDVETGVPGHRPITDEIGVLAMKAYLKYILAETHKRYNAGMSEMEAAQDIALDDYPPLGDAERIVINVNTRYREFGGDDTPADVVDLF